MNKQKKQLLLLLFVLIIAVGAFVLVIQIPSEEEETVVSYTVTNLVADNVTKLSYTNENGTYTFTKQDDIWSYEGDKTLDIDEDSINSMVSSIAALTSENCISQVEDASIYGLTEPTMTILVSDGTTSYTVLVGDYNDVTGTQYICLENDMSTVYTTSSYTVSDFEGGIDDLIVEEEETED